jgi:hypothetical protein
VKKHARNGTRKTARVTTCEIARAARTNDVHGQHDDLREQHARRGGKALELVDLCIGGRQG